MCDAPETKRDRQFALAASTFRHSTHEQGTMTDYQNGARDSKPDYLRQIPAKREGIYRSRLEAKFASHWASDWPDHPAHYEPFRLQAFHGKGRVHIPSRLRNPIRPAHRRGKASPDIDRPSRDEAIAQGDLGIRLAFHVVG